MSKRKSSAVRTQESRLLQPKLDHTNTFYSKESKTIEFNKAQRPAKSTPKPINLVPKTVNQEKYIMALLDDSIDIVVGSGPAGTGKTYLAMLAAIKAMQNKECDRIILTRPAVGVDDEKHGFLPGTLNQKMEPWVIPLLDVLHQYYSVKDTQYMIEEQKIEIAPLAFMRGRNFKHCWIVLDESQNCTPSQIKMLMTRIGYGSKIVITGDTDQGDRKTAENGLLDLVSRLDKRSVNGLQSCKFGVEDVQRHKIIAQIPNLYS
ncbi:MAG: PhoH family protein [Candidatus Nanopelagicus sp.]